MNEIEPVICEMVAIQQKKLMYIGRRIVPALTDDDLLQPQDYPVLEQHPEFRYEEGVLHGMQTVLAALRCWKK